MQNFQVQSRADSQSSGQSYCIKLVDEVFQLSTAGKERVTPSLKTITPCDSTPALTPDELEKAPIAQMASRSSSGLSSYCGKVVDDILVRISLEKVKSPSLEDTHETPHRLDDSSSSLTPDELEQAPIALFASRSSSGMSTYCSNFVDDLLLRISLEKTKFTTPIERQQTPYPLDDTSISLTPDELKEAQIVQSASRASSGLSSYCGTLVDDLLVRISLEKFQTQTSKESSPSSTPDDLDESIIVRNASRSSSGLSSYCGKFVDDLLLRISFEKAESTTPIDRQQTPHPPDDTSLSLTPDELEEVPIVQNASRPSSGLSSYCGKFVDDLLLRISFEKAESTTPIERQQTPYPLDDTSPSLTPDELEEAPIVQNASRSSSGLSSYCGKFVDDLLLRISFEKTESTTPIDRQQTHYPLDDTSPSLTPDELEEVPIVQNASRSSSGLSSYCGKFVDDLLLRISLEKAESTTPIDRQQTPHPPDDTSPSLTPDELEEVPIVQNASRSSSGLSSYCGKFVDDLLVRITVDKPQIRPVSPKERDNEHPISKAIEPPSFELEAADQRSHSSKSLDSYCGRMVDDLLLRISTEKIKLRSTTPPRVERQLTPYHLLEESYNYTPIYSPEFDEASLSSSSSRSSLSSYGSMDRAASSYVSKSGKSSERQSAWVVEEPAITAVKKSSPSCENRSISESSGKSFCVGIVDDVLLRIGIESPIAPERPVSNFYFVKSATAFCNALFSPFQSVNTNPCLFLLGVLSHDCPDFPYRLIWRCYSVISVHIFVSNLLLPFVLISVA